MSEDLATRGFSHDQHPFPKQLGTQSFAQVLNIKSDLNRDLQIHFYSNSPAFSPTFTLSTSLSAPAAAHRSHFSLSSCLTQ